MPDEQDVVTSADWSPDDYELPGFEDLRAANAALVNAKTAVAEAALA